MNQESRIRNLRGQSLIEIMIGVAVSVILIVSAATLLSVTLKSSTQNKFIQAASFLSQDLIDKVTIFAEKQWNCAPGAACGIYNLNKGPDNYYHLLTTGGTFISDPKDETVSLDGVNYTRYFYVEDVIRELCGVGDICTGPNCSVSFCPSGPGGSGAAYDPSTQKVTVVTEWNQAGTGGDIKIVKYLTRSVNRVFLQTDWSGGPGQPNLWVVQNKFDISNYINYTGTAGSIRLP